MDTMHSTELDAPITRQACPTAVDLLLNPGPGIVRSIPLVV